MLKINKIIKKAIDTVMENNISDISSWCKENFLCDITHDETYLNDLVDYYAELVCIELGIDIDCIERECHTELVKEICEITKDRLFEEIQQVTDKFVVLQDIDIEQIKADMQIVCDRLNGCKTLQDISDYAIWNSDKLGVITSINFYDVDYPDIEEAIENNVGKEKISFICFSQLGEVNHLVFHFKDGKTNIDSVEFDIYDKEDKRICLQEMMLSNFIDNDKEDYER